MSHNDRVRVRGSNAGPLIGGAIIGLAIGLAIAWMLFPVRWSNTDPADLRATHQDEYIRMAADALAVTGDADLARTRLAALAYDGNDLGQVSAAVERLAVQAEAEDDAAAAVRLRLMAQATQLPAATAEEVAPAPLLVFSPNWLAVGGVAIFAATATLVLWVLFRRRDRERAPAATTEPAAATGRADEERYAGPSAPRQEAPTMGTGGWQAGAGGESAGRPSRFSAPPPGGSAVATGPLRPSPLYPPVDEEAFDEANLTEEQLAALMDRADRAGVPDEDEELYAEIEAQAAEAEDDLNPETAEDDARWTQDDLAAEGEEAVDFSLDDIEFAAGARPAAPPPPVVPDSEAPPDALGVFEAEYHYGDDDFDCSFNIEAERGFMGECGVGVSEVLSSDTARRVAVLEVWLFDKSDIRTESKLLVSEYVARDPALSAQLSAKGELVVARPGEVITLETLWLTVTATVRACRYLPDVQQPNSAFEHINIELVAERGDALS